MSAADRLGAGVIVCGYKYPDMMYEELYENLSPSFAMLLIASARAIGEGVAEGVVSVTMPLKVHELTGLTGYGAASDRAPEKEAACNAAAAQRSGPEG